MRAVTFFFTLPFFSWVVLQEKYDKIRPPLSLYVHASETGGSRNDGEFRPASRVYLIRFACSVLVSVAISLVGGFHLTAAHISWACDLHGYPFTHAALAAAAPLCLTHLPSSVSCMAYSPELRSCPEASRRSTLEFELAAFIPGRAEGVIGESDFPLSAGM